MDNLIDYESTLLDHHLPPFTDYKGLSKDGITTFIEVILNQELGEPFRRDAMKKPVQVAGINKKDMKPQVSENN